MDILQMLGMVAALVIPIGSLVKTSVDIAIKNLGIEQPAIYAMNYSMCMLLMMILVFSTNPFSLPIFLQAVIGGVAAGNWAAMQTDSHNAARDDSHIPSDPTPSKIILTEHE